MPTTAADFGCIPDNLETAIIDDIRDRLTEAMEPYAALIQSWEGSDEDWKFKYYVAAMTRNPTTNAPYRIANIRLMPKIGKHDARDVAGVHTTINQPFALIDSIMLAGLVQSLPMFLQDSDTLTRQLSELRVRRSAKFVSIDIRRLYLLRLFISSVD